MINNAVTPRLMRERWPFDIPMSDRVIPFNNSGGVKDIIEQFGYNKNGGINLNIREEDNQFIYEFYLTGFNKNEINLNVDNNKLTVSASKEDEGDYVYREGPIKVSRTTTLPNNINTQTVNATYEDGILYVTFQKTGNQNNPKQIPIK